MVPVVWGSASSDFVEAELEQSLLEKMMETLNLSGAALASQQRKPIGAHTSSLASLLPLKSLSKELPAFQKQTSRGNECTMVERRPFGEGKGK
jgi:hypothetical protein